MDLATYNANKPPTSQVHKTLPGVPLDGAVVSGTPSLTGESMPVEKSKVVSGLTAMAAFLETIGKLKALAVDKTGTISEGRPRVSRVVSVDSNDKAEIGRIAAAFDRHSDHPLIWDRTLLAIWHRQSSESSAETFDF